jgi:hypothetical protein
MIGGFGRPGLQASLKAAPPETASVAQAIAATGSPAATRRPTAVRVLVTRQRRRARLSTFAATLTGSDPDASRRTILGNVRPAKRCHRMEARNAHKKHSVRALRANAARSG